MEYEIVKDDTPDGLVREVAKWVESGWRPAGGVCVCQRHTDTATGMIKPYGVLWAQAVIREREDEQG